ncbi:MAG: HD domain-containing phosphohydrolase [Vicinamibacterales bacterium]
MIAPLSQRAWQLAYVLVVVCGALVVAVSLRQMIAEPVPLSWFVLAGLTVVSGAATLRLPNAPVSFSISDSFTITAALLFGPAAGAVIVTIDTLVISRQLARRELRVRRLAFNVAVPALAMWVAAHGFFLGAGVGPLIADERPVAGLLLPLLLFTAGYFILNTAVVACAIAFEQRQNPADIWRRHFLPLWVGHFGGGSVAAILITLVHSRGADWTALALVAGIPLVFYAMFKNVLGRVQDQLVHLEDVNKMHVATIETLAHAIDAKDQVTHGHLRRVQVRAKQLAIALGIDDSGDRRALEAASLLHDLGKLAVPEHILNKPGKLTAAELEVMRRHASIGADILSSMDFSYPVVPIVRHHHENWDGTGYPRGLRGEQIPLGARILAVVDCYDALTSDRPYRPKMSSEEAVAVLQERSGTMYEPRVVDTFVRLLAAEPADTHPAPGPAAFTLISETMQSDAARRVTSAGVVDPGLLGIMLDAGVALGRRPHDIGDLTHSAVSQLMPAMSTAIYLYDPATDSMTAEHVSGRYVSALKGMVIPFGQRVSGWVAAQRSSIRNSDAALDLGSLTMRLSPPPRTCLSAALQLDGVVVGAITIYSASAEPFTEYHAAIVDVLAPRIAAACAGRQEPAAGRDVADLQTRRAS